MNDFEPFHSAVNRIPVLRDEAQALAEDGKLPEDLFAAGRGNGLGGVSPWRIGTTDGSPGLIRGIRLIGVAAPGEKKGEGDQGSKGLE